MTVGEVVQMLGGDRSACRRPVAGSLALVWRLMLALSSDSESLLLAALSLELVVDGSVQMTPPHSPRFLYAGRASPRTAQLTVELR